MTTTTELLKQGRRNEVWRKYCGFLDLGIERFMKIQERLLLEQLQLVGGSELGRILMGDNPPRDVEEFRRRVRLTTYEDYAAYLDAQREDVLAERPVAWAHTSGRSGRFKWVPYSQRTFTKIGEGILTAVILATARQRGEVRLAPNDVLVWNVAARPYISGYAALSLAELFELRYVPSVEEMEKMSFQQRIETGFQMGLRTGIDVIGSISSVLVRVGEQFAEGANTNGFSPSMLHPAVLFRLVRGWLRSRLAGRPLLPKDLWQVKGVIVGGTDTAIYRQKLIEYWGVEPYEAYGCTEAAAAMAVEPWTGEGLYFLPDVCFLEFVPEAEWTRWRKDSSYIPQTVLLDQVKVGERYEVVITNYYGGPFLRYRLHDLVRFVALQDEKTGIKLPSMVFAGRDSDLIDLAGFTGLIDEKLIWQAIANTGINYEEWAVRKELLELHAGLHLYIELKEALPATEVAERVHKELQALNPFYSDLVDFLGTRPIQVTVLAPGSFSYYMRERQAAGVDPAHLKPPHMNAPDAVIADLLRSSETVAQPASHARD
jgi:hypothetical protein